MPVYVNYKLEDIIPPPCQHINTEKRQRIKEIYTEDNDFPKYVPDFDDVYCLDCGRWI